MEKSRLPFLTNANFYASKYIQLKLEIAFNYSTRLARTNI